MIDRSMTRNRVRIIAGQWRSRLLQFPNHIGAKDFAGWVQERGLNFATRWDPRYETVLAS